MCPPPVCVPFREHTSHSGRHTNLRGVERRLVEKASRCVGCGAHTADMSRMAAGGADHVGGLGFWKCWRVSITTLTMSEIAAAA